MTARGTAALLLILALSGAAGAPPDEPPRDVGLTERAGRRLAQLDVTVSGPAEAIANLGAEDFELSVMGRPIEEFLVDRLCPQPAPAQAEPAESTPVQDVEAPAAAPAPPVAPVSYLFYFDQHHLLPEGRQSSLDTARDLIPRLVVPPNRAMIVSSGEETAVFAEMTGDVEFLLAALDRLEHDRQQWDPYPFQEETRINDVLRALRDSEDRAKHLARIYQREERWHMQRAMHLFSITLGRLADVDPPKAVIYFADTMRSNAGAHYMSFFGSRPEQVSSDPTLAAMELDSFSAKNAFDRVVEEAGALGIRLYTVQARGLVSESIRAPSGSRHKDAQDSLVGLAAETGGEAFLRGVRSTRIAERIREDLACVYLISFDPAGLPEDRGLAVVLRSKRPAVKLQVRGQIVLQSESERTSSRLLAAFADAGGGREGPVLRGVVVPTGFVDGSFSALVQLEAPASPVSDAQWELGLSLVARGKVREDNAGSLSVSGPGVPVVFESVMSFKPGPYEIAMVAREATEGRILSTRVDGEWPDPDLEPVTLGPIAALQPAQALFLRDGAVRTSGSLGRAATDLLRPDLPTALIGIVCHSRSRKQSLTVERGLEGESSVDFPPLVLELGDERCAQFRDLIPENVMTPGSFVYSVRVRRAGEEGGEEEGEELASSRTELLVVDAAGPAATAGTAP